MLDGAFEVFGCNVVVFEVVVVLLNIPPVVAGLLPKIPPVCPVGGLLAG